jgi:hypothetical protein
MRRNPVRRDEISFNGSRITTLPPDSLRADKWGRLDSIPRLWVPLVRSLNRTQKRDWDSRAAMRETASRAGIRGFQPPRSITIPQPYQAGLGPCTCEQCGREFYRAKHGSRRYCSDDCAAAAGRAHRAQHNTEMVRERSEARTAARSGQTCIICGEPLEAARSTRRTCSDRCRTAAHRRAKQHLAEARR